MPASRRPRSTTSAHASGDASNARKHPAPWSRRRDYVDRSKLPPPPREEVRIWAMCHGPDMFSYLMEQWYKRAEREEIRKMHEAKRKENEAKRQARLEEQNGTKALAAVDAESSTAASSTPSTSTSSTQSSGQRRGQRAGRGRRRQQQQGTSGSSSAASAPGPSNDSRDGNNNDQQAAPDASAQPRIVDRRTPAGLTPPERHQFAKQFMNPRSLAARRTSWPNEFVASGNSLFGGAWQIA